MRSTRGAIGATRPVPARAGQRHAGGVMTSVAACTAKWHGRAAGQVMLRGVELFHRALYRASGGRLGRTLAGAPVLLLTTTGRQTGQPRTHPLCYLEVAGRLVVVASAGGAARYPAWYLNLRRDSRVTVRRGPAARTMVARTAIGAERARLWEQIVARYPMCAGYQRAAGREIPIVVLQ